MRVFNLPQCDKMRLSTEPALKLSGPFQPACNVVAPLLLALSVIAMLTGGISQRAEAAKYAAIVIEEDSGKVLFSRSADSLRYPASLTKIMTLYLVFEELASGRLKIDSRMRVSRLAAGRSPSKLYLKTGQSITVENAIYALVTKSANDVATAIAEHLSGSEREFAKRMTRKARALGMSRTTFRNASGLPHSKQRSTARDMARLAVAMRRDFPQFYDFFSARSFRWKGQKFRTTTSCCLPIREQTASRQVISTPLVSILLRRLNGRASD